MSQIIPQLVKDDLWLEPYTYEINERYERYLSKKEEIIKLEGSLLKYASAYQYLGINYDSNLNGWWYREWAPSAHELSVIGDFNQWDDKNHKMTRLPNGVWEIFIQEKEDLHATRFKVRIKGSLGIHDRLPAYIKRVLQDKRTHMFDAQFWKEQAFDWTDANFDLNKIDTPIIYEAHVGLAQNKEDVGTFNEFTDHILPRIKANGYNCIQLMAIQEHPYYGSFGYHVSNFFATSSRFGTPEDLKRLVNTAHEMGIAVIMDIVHSHAVKNINEGLNKFDGTDQYFHSGGRGNHDQWDSKIFDYGKEEVQQFLLSNVKYWIEEFHFDGFRFDGVTSMLYHHHGMFIDFDHYDKYFKEGTEWDAITYLQLANDLIHELKPNALSIAEDMSGMPGLCRKIEDGGIGFDYRLGMGIPDNWIKLLKHQEDQNWDINEIWSFLANRRAYEKTIAYAESHDQALVGDKTLAFWLMDKEMYWHMEKSNQNIIIDRGIALHKIIRLITMSIGGEGYLNFIGNEFGHPEWLDFPREGNNWSYKHCKRQWNLVDNGLLKFEYLNEFDKEMISVIKENHILSSMPAQKYNMDTTNQVIVAERNNLIFVFNFSPTNSIFGYEFPVHQTGDLRIVLNSDDSRFGGFDRVDDSINYPTFNDDGTQKVSLYLPNRTALVLKNVNSN